jgi:RimJ/RimL family protein N-acetyltransferase
MYGKNVAVRAIEVGDLSQIVEWRNDPSVYRGFVEYAPLSVAGQALFLETHGLDSGRMLWMIDWIDRAVPGATPIGMVGLMGLDMRNRRCEFGPIFVGNRSYRGRGAALDSELLALNYAFGHLGMHKVFAHVTESNAEVVPFHAKAGFRLEHTLREHIFRNGQFESVYLMSVLESEFRDHVAQLSWEPHEGAAPVRK